MEFDIQVVNALNEHYHAKMMRNLGAIFGAKRVIYTDNEPRELYVLEKPDGSKYRLKISGNKDQGGFLSDVETFDRKEQVWVGVDGTKKKPDGTIVDWGSCK